LPGFLACFSINNFKDILWNLSPDITVEVIKEKLVVHFCTKSADMHHSSKMAEIIEDEEILLLFSILKRTLLRNTANPNAGPCMQLVISDLLGKAQDRFFCMLQMNSNLCHLGRLLLDELHTLELHSCF
jgi:hypothetical protein